MSERASAMLAAGWHFVRSGGRVVATPPKTFSWGFDAPDDVVKNEFLSRTMAEYCFAQATRLNTWHRNMHEWAGHEGGYDACVICHPPPPIRLVAAWRRFRWWFYEHRPHWHWGPCQQEDW